MVYYDVCYRLDFEIATVYPLDVKNYILDLNELEHKNRRNSSMSSISVTESDSNSESSSMFSNNNPYMLSIIKRFDFDSKLARMSVVVKNK